MSGFSGFSLASKSVKTDKIIEEIKAAEKLANQPDYNLNKRR